MKAAMSATTVPKSWPIITLAAVALAGLVAGGVAGGTIAATLGFLVVGPAYLIEQAVRRRRTPPPPKDEAAKARDDARLVRALVLLSLAMFLVALSQVFARPADWLEGRRWSAGLLLLAALGLSSSFHVLALADASVTGKTRRWAWTATAIVDLAIALTASVAAVGNHAERWLGGPGWTVGLALAAAWCLLSAATCLGRLKAPADAGR
jgi:hypothetical protein